MKLFGYDISLKAEPVAPPPTGDVPVDGMTTGSDGVFKAYMPEYLYNPPFGYPRSINYPLIRQLSRNPYVYSVIKTVIDQAATMEWEIVYKEGVEETPAMDEVKKNITRFLNNPNANTESLADIQRAMLKDLLELDSGVIIKVFNKAGKLKELYARDGASFLKNPDIYGTMSNRAAYVKPMTNEYLEPAKQGNNIDPTVLQRYAYDYKNNAAYFQYGNSPAALPVPFGRREVMFFEINKRSDSVYGQSPIQILADVITTLVYGSNYNLDFYMNANMPEGIVELVGANNDQVRAIRERMENVAKVRDPGTGFSRRVGYRVGYTNVPTKFTTFQLPPKEMEIISQQEWFTKVLWMCFGVTADEMGFTENSNRATGQEQTKAAARKAIKPLLQTLKYRMDMEVIPEWGAEAADALEFKYVEVDIDRDTKFAQLQQLYIGMGVKTPEMVADEIGIDWSRVQETQALMIENQQGMQEQVEGNLNAPDADLEAAYNDELGIKHKYIKRTGGPGNYKYFYDEPKVGKREAKKPIDKLAGPHAAAIKLAKQHYEESGEKLSVQEIKELAAYVEKMGITQGSGHPALGDYSPALEKYLNDRDEEGKQEEEEDAEDMQEDIEETLHEMIQLSGTKLTTQIGNLARRMNEDREYAKEVMNQLQVIKADASATLDIMDDGGGDDDEDRDYREIVKELKQVNRIEKALKEQKKKAAAANKRKGVRAFWAQMDKSAQRNHDIRKKKETKERERKRKQEETQKKLKEKNPNRSKDGPIELAKRGKQDRQVTVQKMSDEKLSKTLEDVDDAINSIDEQVNAMLASGENADPDMFRQESMLSETSLQLSEFRDQLEVEMTKRDQEKADTAEANGDFFEDEDVQEELETVLSTKERSLPKKMKEIAQKMSKDKEYAKQVKEQLILAEERAKDVLEHMDYGGSDSDEDNEYRQIKKELTQVKLARKLLKEHTRAGKKSIDDEDAETKALPPVETDLEQELVKRIKEKAAEIEKLFDEEEQ